MGGSVPTDLVSSEQLRMINICVYGYLAEAGVGLGLCFRRGPPQDPTYAAEPVSSGRSSMCLVYFHAGTALLSVVLCAHNSAKEKDEKQAAEQLETFSLAGNWDRNFTSIRHFEPSSMT